MSVSRRYFGVAISVLALTSALPAVVALAQTTTPPAVSPTPSPTPQPPESLSKSAAAAAQTGKSPSKATLSPEDEEALAIQHHDELIEWRGRVISADVATGNLVIMRDDYVERTIAIDSFTQIYKQHKEAILTDIASDDLLAIHLRKDVLLDGNRVADIITDFKSASGNKSRSKYPLPLRPSDTAATVHTTRLYVPQKTTSPTKIVVPKVPTFTVPPYQPRTRRHKSGSLY